MPGESTTSNAEMRSVAMNRNDSPRSYTSRTFPRRASGKGRDVSRIAAVMARDCSSALLDRNEVSSSRSRVNLPRPRDLLVGIDQHFLPLRQPAGDARNREEHREHVDRELQRLVDQAGVE